ncbi:DUF167 domain-containing protein [Rhizobium sp. CG5]|uniref:DUF167 domain-containing protein n=1 Tax=Rhizobium sp. CG5 TaxID=2726076 RepID=UPI002033D60B|nr:DUF167 domain-containing protein [Rhizobium sp. CG5]MCM2475313.1 DUF167 domain-containing protein [Rhizobium sp. CG5]
MSLPYRIVGDHVRLSVRLTPNGGREAIDGVEINSGGEAYLKVRVTAVPEKGKANKALIALLAKRLGMAKSSIEITSGDTARQKNLRLEGEPEVLIAKLTALLDG